MRVRVIQFLLIVLSYLFVFNPQFIFFRDRWAPANLIVMLASLLMVVKRTVIIFFIKNFRLEFYILIYMLLYVIFRSIDSDYSSFIVSHILAVLSLFVVVPFFIYYSYILGGDKIIIKTLMIIAISASFITLLSIIFPTFGLYVREKIALDDYLLFHDYRGFGFASLLTSNYGFVLGFIAGIGSWYLNSYKWFLFFIPIIMLSAIVNARTGAIVAVIGIILKLIFAQKTYYLFLILLFGSITLSNLEGILSFVGIDGQTIAFLLSFQDQISSIFSEGDILASKTASELLVDMWVLPDSFDEWLWGKGYNIFNEAIGERSDVGWIIELNYGGLLYLIPLCLLIIIMCIRLLLCRKRVYMLYFLTVFILINTKSSIYPGYSLFYIMVMIYYIYILDYKHQYLNNREMAG